MRKEGRRVGEVGESVGLEVGGEEGVRCTRQGERGIVGDVESERPDPRDGDREERRTKLKRNKIV